MSYAERDKLIDPQTGNHLPMNLGELIDELTEIAEVHGRELTVHTSDGVGDTRQMWSASYDGFGGVDLYLTAEEGY